MRRRTTLAAALAPVVLALPLVGCSTVQNALDCANTAVVVVDSANALQQAVADGVENPAEVDRSLDRINENLDKIIENTDNADITRVAEDMQKAADNVRESVEQGRTPDVGPLADAADELTQVCTPG
ncbi:hypothetical protein [Streptomyces radiopugnans]|uniref:Secreted protein n=1 Tax=Streptomyces radiopugnans TaxID=403935 RepID=A0A1H8YUZ3_9ACTN|nr:hypothetical protein [Streptomyces radiopugnans]SEP56020.1 hypothetical protein SAMN05216481_10176 [Streptomyces radiopugnans]